MFARFDLSVLLIAVLFILLPSVSFADSEKDASGIPWKIGDDCGAGYRVSNIIRHTEFVQLNCNKDEISHAVEIVPVTDCNNCVKTKYYLIQTLPGVKQKPEFMDELQQQLFKWEEKWGHEPFVKSQKWLPPDGDDDGGFLYALKEIVTGYQNGFPVWLQMFFIAIAGIFLGMLPKKFAPEFLYNFSVRISGFMDWLLKPVMNFIAACIKRFPMWANTMNQTSQKVSIPYAVLVAVLSFVYLNLLSGVFFSWDVATDQDTVRDFLLAKDCLAGINCHFAGPPSSFLGNQGALWIHFLVAAQWFGLEMFGIQQLVFIGISVAGAILYGIIWRLRSVSAAVVGLCIFLSFGLITIDSPTLQNSIVTPLPFMLLLLSSYWLMQSKSRLAIIVTAFIAAICVETHLVFLICLPFVSFLVAYCARNGVFGVLLAVSVVFGVWILSSYEALDNDLRGMIAHNLLLPFILGNMVAVIIGWRCRVHRDFLVLEKYPGVLLVFFTALQWLIILGLLIFLGHQFSAYYFFAATPGICLLIGMAYDKCKLKRKCIYRIWAGFSVLIIISLLLLRYILPMFFMTDKISGMLHAHLEKNGFIYLEHLEHIHIGAVRQEKEMLNSIVLFSKQIADSKQYRIDPPEKDAYFSLMNEERLPERHPDVEVVGDYNGQLLLFWSMAPWIKRNQMQIVYGILDDDDKMFEVEIVTSIYNNSIRKCMNEDKFSWECMSYMDLNDLSQVEQYKHNSLSSVKYTFPIVAEDEKERLICIPSLGINYQAAWEITDVEGIGFSGDLPGTRIVLKGGENSKGSITVSVDIPEAENTIVPFRKPPYYPPTVLEIPTIDSYLCPSEKNTKYFSKK